MSSTVAGGWDKRPTSNTAYPQRRPECLCWEGAEGWPLPTGPLSPNHSPHPLPLLWLICHRTRGGEAVMFQEGLPPAHPQTPRAGRDLGDRGLRCPPRPPPAERARAGSFLCVFWLHIWKTSECWHLPPRAAVNTCSEPRTVSGTE